jgi:effector-binding domain-containing protein
MRTTALICILGISTTMATVARATDYTVTQKTLPVQQTMVMVGKVTNEADLSSKMADYFPKVFQYLSSKNIQPLSAPFARFLIFQPGTNIIFEAGSIVATGSQGEGDVITSSLPSGDVAMTVYEGPYEQIQPAYDAINAWIAQNHKSVSGPPWEIYVSEGSATSDPTTEIYQPIR